MFFYDATVCYVALADAHELHCAVDELGGDCEPCCVGVCFSAPARGSGGGEPPQVVEGGYGVVE